MESSITITLQYPVQKTVEGELQDIHVVDIIAPRKKLLRKTYRLQQYMTAAMLDAQETFKSMSSDSDSDEGKKDAQLDAKAVMSMLLASRVDIEACFNEFEKLALKGGIEIDGDPINQIQYNKFDESDLEVLLAEYLANFIMSLVMKVFTA